LVKNLNLQDFS